MLNLDSKNLVERTLSLSLSASCSFSILWTSLLNLRHILHHAFVMRSQKLNV